MSDGLDPRLVVVEDDPELDALLGGVIDSIDRDLADDPGCPDLAAVVARAHELDPGRITAEVAAEVAQWAPVVAISQAHRRRRTRDDLELLAVVAGVRAEVEQDVAQRLGTPPPVPLQRRGVRGSRVWAMVAVAAAAMLVIGFGVLGRGGRSLERDDPSRHEAALVGPAPGSTPTQEGTPSVEPRTSDELAADDSAASAPELVEPSVPEAADPIAVDEAAVDEAADEASTAPSDRAKPRAARAEPTLEELDAMAHAAWRAGDLSEAERLFRRLAKRAGTGRLGDLAYGDLFTLARQRGEPQTEVTLWREYLRRFPQGRFADDASAGLCRRARPDERGACWQRYLDTMPDGAHRAQARRALDAEETTP